MLSLNVRGLNSTDKRDSLKHLLTAKQPDVFIGLETWLNDNKQIHEDYHHFFTPHSAHQGILILVKKYLRAKSLTKSYNTNCVISVTLTLPKKTINVIGFYNRPSKKVQCIHNLRILIDRLKEIQNDPAIILATDLNEQLTDA